MSGKARKNGQQGADDGPDADALLVQALAGGMSMAAAARACNLNEKTVRRRMADDGFRRRVGEARGQLLEQASAQMLARLAGAGQVLQDLLAAESEQVRLGAARAIAQLALALRNAHEIEQRITALEQAAGTTDADRLGQFRSEYSGQQGGDNGA